MKKIKFFLVILCIGLITGCANKPVMPPIKYNKPIEFQVKKNAYLNWEVGKQYAGSTASSTYQGSNDTAGAIGALIFTALDSADRANNPSRYTLSYGKAEQTVFMTSLRDVLVENNVFKQVELISDPKQVSPKDVLVNVYFKMARVSLPEKGSTITLSVEMVISHNGKPPFKRTYLVQSNAEKFGDGFREQQIDVSNRLLEKMIAGIQEWHNMNTVRSKK